MKRLATPLVAAAIFLLGMWLNWPLFLPGELPFRGSIEGGYAATARFISAHPDPWGWNPLPYGGVPTQFLYLPALPYLTAALARLLPSLEPEYLYRLLAAVLTCLGPVTVFLFALYFTGSRRWSLAAALAVTLFSPSYGLFPQVEKDRGTVALPWRIQVMAKYGEGPHAAGLTLMLPALAALWAAGKSRGGRLIAVAAAALAAVALTNWVSALALAISALLLLAAASGDTEFRAWRALAAAGLAYLLACFWLTPTFVGTIAFNWPADAFGYQLRQNQVLLVAALGVSLAALWLVFRRLRAPAYLGFVTLCAFAFGWLATAFYVFGVDTIPESRRYAVEFELFLALALVEAFRLSLASANQTVRLCAYLSGGMLLLAGAPQAWSYLAQGREAWMPTPRNTTVEYRLGQWLDGRRPRGRVFASGGLRFRLNTWFDIAQAGGSFESGLRNRLPVDLAYQIRTCKAIPPDREASDALLMLKALGVEYLVVHGPQSQEYYRDYYHPRRMDGVLPVVYGENDDTVYQLPARGLAHLIRLDEMPGGDANQHAGVLARYVAARDDESRPALRTRWPDPGTLMVEGSVPAGYYVAVQANWDPGWKAVQDGREIPIGRDSLGFMTLHAAPAAAARIELRYRGTAEPRLMAAVSALAWLGLAAMLARRPKPKIA